MGRGPDGERRAGPSGCCGDGGGGRGSLRVGSRAGPVATVEHEQPAGARRASRAGHMAGSGGRPPSGSFPARSSRPEGGESPREVFETFPGAVSLAPRLEGLLGMRGWSAGGCACQRVASLGWCVTRTTFSSCRGRRPPLGRGDTRGSLGSSPSCSSRAPAARRWVSGEVHPSRWSCTADFLTDLGRVA